MQQHKDLYDQEVQSIVQKRLGKYKGMEEQMEKLSPMLRLMQQRYGVQNVEDLARAVMNDNAYYEDEASRHGMDVETFKQLEMTRMENQRLREQQEASERDRQTAQKMLGWRAGGGGAEEGFPGLFPGRGDREQQRGDVPPAGKRRTHGSRLQGAAHGRADAGNPGGGGAAYAAAHPGDHCGPGHAARGERCGHERRAGGEIRHQQAEPREDGGTGAPERTGRADHPEKMFE